jgi:hypothetical protein
MALTEVQLTTLFLGAFGQSVDELGFALDSSGAAPVVKKGTHTVSLLVFEDNAIEWQVDGAPLVPFTLNGRDQRSAAVKADALAKLTAAIG